jgi:5'-methylthioadenosine phosphorylase
MPVGIITGSGTYALPGFAEPEEIVVSTPFGEVSATRGGLGGHEVVHLSRHGVGHVRLSNHVNHRANIWALRELGASAVIGCTACGAVDGTLALGSLIVFDDLHFIANRLPDGSLCTMFGQAGDPARAHWILHGGPYSEEVRDVLRHSAADAGHPLRDRGTYGHVDGPRFNTPAEIAALADCGVSAVSQTGGPETVLCGELELPFALIGFVTDYANEVKPGETTPVAELVGLMGQSTAVLADVLSRAVTRLADSDGDSDPEAGAAAPATPAPAPAGTVFRFG